MTQNQNLFFQKFGITPNDLQRYLGEALSAGGDYADLYFEYLTSTSISVDESIVKSASQGISAGCGVRVLAGERTGYAYTDDLAPEKILRAARTAALIARGPAKSPIEGFKENLNHQLYPIASPSADADIAAKLELVMRADRAARAYDPRVVQVRAGYFDEMRQILVIGSDGTFATDRPANGAIHGEHDCQVRREFRQRRSGRRRTRGHRFLYDGEDAGTFCPGRRAAGRLSSWARLKLRRAKWKLYWDRAGRESCCMKPLAMDWKQTSIAKAHRLSPAWWASA